MDTLGQPVEIAEKILGSDIGPDKLFAVLALGLVWVIVHRFEKRLDVLAAEVKSASGLLMRIDARLEGRDPNDDTLTRL